MAGKSRPTIWVDNEDPRLRDTAVSVVVRSTNGLPVIVERAMWWPGPTASTWAEAHASPGSTATGTQWCVAEGESGPGVDTYLRDLIRQWERFLVEGRKANLFKEIPNAYILLAFLGALQNFFDMAPLVRELFGIDARSPDVARDYANTLIEIFLEAGAVFTNPTCGACNGGHMGLIGAGERCITASTRNFKGRMGSKDSEVLMASPAAVAASAIHGVVYDPRKLS